jgi:hypothetical protein
MSTKAIKTMEFWIVQSIFESNIMSDYINKEKETKVLTSIAYRIISKIIDLGIYGYLMYFIIMHW